MMYSSRFFLAKKALGYITATVFFVASFMVQAQNKINGVRVWPSPESTRVVFDLSDKPDFSYFMLENPLRLVVDLKDTDKFPSLPGITNEHQLIKRIRYSTSKSKKSTRVVFDLLEATKPVIFALAPTGPYKDRLVVDLYARDGRTEETTKVAKHKPLANDRDIVIAVDAGHGGEDPGSIGPNGSYEKDVTLPIAKRLAKMINAEKGMKAVLIRGGDYFVNLNTRSARARKHKADFLVSIHADAFTSPQPNGASVWILSLKRANSEIGKWLEDTEKHSELLGGAADVIKDTENEKYLAQTLLDMSMDHAMKTGFTVAEQAVRELKKVAKLHKKAPQAASLAVLKSPDIPSMLVETGFISNPKEERLLKTASHQEKLARAVFNSIRTYFKKNPPDDSLFARMKASEPREHKVSAGESLSVVASRYGISVNRLKSANKLSSNTLYIGQVLTIPNT